MESIKLNEAYPFKNGTFGFIVATFLVEKKKYLLCMSGLITWKIFDVEWFSMDSISMWTVVVEKFRLLKRKFYEAVKIFLKMTFLIENLSVNLNFFQLENLNLSRPLAKIRISPWLLRQVRIVYLTNPLPIMVKSVFSRNFFHEIW